MLPNNSLNMNSSLRYFSGESRDRTTGKKEDNIECGMTGMTHFPMDVEKMTTQQTISYALQQGEQENDHWAIEHHQAIAQHMDAHASESLEHAARFGNLGLMQQCLSHGVEQEALNRALAAAVQADQCEVAKNLVRAGADYMTRLDDKSILTLIVELGKVDMMEAMIAGGADIWQLRTDGTNPLFIAARHGHVQMIALLSHQGMNLNAALFEMVNQGDYFTVSMLVKAGAAAFQPQGTKSISAFQLALKKNQDAMARLFLNLQDDTIGCDRIKEIRDDFLAAVIAKSDSGWARAKEWLEKIPSLIDISESKGRTALHLACIVGNTKLEKLLLENGANINARLSHGGTLVHSAAGTGNTELLSRLIRAGADVNAVDYEGHTPLHIAAIKSKGMACNLLVENGAKVDVVNRFSLTPLHYAVEILSHDEVDDMLGFLKLDDLAKLDLSLFKSKNQIFDRMVFLALCERYVATLPMLPKMQNKKLMVLAIGDFLIRAIQDQYIPASLASTLCNVADRDAIDLALTREIRRPIANAEIISALVPHVSNKAVRMAFAIECRKKTANREVLAVLSQFLLVYGPFIQGLTRRMTSQLKEGISTLIS